MRHRFAWPATVAGLPAAGCAEASCRPEWIARSARRAREKSPIDHRTGSRVAVVDEADELDEGGESPIVVAAKTALRESDCTIVSRIVDRVRLGGIDNLLPDQVSDRIGYSPIAVIDVAH